MSSRTIGPDVGDHLDRERRAVDARQAAEPQDGGGHAGAGVAGGHDRVGLAALDEVHRDEDRRVLLLAQGERRDARPCRSPARRGRSRRWPAASPAIAADRRLVADEDDPVVGMAPGVVEGARDDLGRPVVAAHRVDRDADAGARRSQRHVAAARSPRQRAASSGRAAGLSSMASRPL